jgi:hypothetical protein
MKNLNTGIRINGIISMKIQLQHSFFNQTNPKLITDQRPGSMHTFTCQKSKKQKKAVTVNIIQKHIINKHNSKSAIHKYSKRILAIGIIHTRHIILLRKKHSTQKTVLKQRIIISNTKKRRN